MRCIAFRSRLRLTPRLARRFSASAISVNPKPFNKSLRSFSLDWQLIEFAAFLLGNLALPKAFQQIASLFVAFFNAHPLNQASLFRGFALKKPVTFVTGFVSRSRADSNRCRSFCRALPSHSATGPFFRNAKITQRS